MLRVKRITRLSRPIIESQGEFVEKSPDEKRKLVAWPRFSSIYEKLKNPSESYLYCLYLSFAAENVCCHAIGMKDMGMSTAGHVIWTSLIRAQQRATTITMGTTKNGDSYRAWEKSATATSRAESLEVE